MDFILGVLAFMQMTFFPGLLIYRLFRFRANLFDKALVIFGTSLIANYCAIFLLSVLGIYTRTIVGILMLVELAAILWFYRRDFTVPVRQLLEETQDGLYEIASLFFPRRGQGGTSVLNYFVILVLLLLSAGSILWVINIFVRNLGSVFSAWDAVVAWNKWATIWAESEIPMNSHFYPQLVPANWSLTYVLPGSPVIQFFAKGLMPLFAVMMLLGLFNLVLLTKNYHFLVSIILLQQLLSSYLNTGIYSGYVDIAVSFFTFAALYILLKAHDTPETDQRSQLYILGALLSAGAAVAKQAGVYIALCYPVLVYADIVFSKVQVEKKQVKTWLGLFAAISIIWVSWYAFKQIAIWTGADYANIDTLVNISAGRYENMSAFQRIVTSLSQRLEMVILFLLILLAFPWMDRLYKVLTILFAPYPLLWGWMASYDTRNLAVFLPVLALVAGYSIHFLLLQLVKLGERGRVLQTPVYVPVAFACVALVGLSFVLTPARLQQRQVDLQRQIFSPAKNQLLFDLIAENGSQTRILTNYPMKYIPGLEEYQVRFDFHDYDAFLANVKNPEVEYLLVPNAIDREIKDYINARVEAGDYQVIVKDKQWKVFTLIRILNRDDPSLQDSE